MRIKFVEPLITALRANKTGSSKYTNDTLISSHDFHLGLIRSGLQYNSGFRINAVELEIRPVNEESELINLIQKSKAGHEIAPKY